VLVSQFAIRITWTARETFTKPNPPGLPRNALAAIFLTPAPQGLKQHLPQDLDLRKRNEVRLAHVGRTREQLPVHLEDRSSLLILDSPDHLAQL
jgi:hypothetical protein